MARRRAGRRAVTGTRVARPASATGHETSVKQKQQKMGWNRAGIAFGLLRRMRDSVWLKIVDMH